MVKKQVLTQGRIFPALTRFALPFLLANLLQALYGAADLLIVGRFGDPAGVAAVATGSQVMQTVTGLIVGLSTGGTVLIGQHYGAGRKRDLADSAASMILLFGLLSILSTAVLFSSSKPIINAMQVPAEAEEDAIQYLFLCSFGLVFIIGYNAVSGILRGVGDSKTPLLLVAAACAVNVAADLLLVGGLHMGAAGAALATVFAQGFSLFLAALFLNRTGTALRFRRLTPRARPGNAAAIIRLGLPIALQEGLINLSFLLITSLLNEMGLTASAAVGVVEKLIVFSMLPTTAIASTVAVMTAQNQGAGRTDRAARCMWSGILLALIPGIACFVLTQRVPAALIGIFSVDPGVIASGTDYLISYGLDCVMVCVVFCANAFFSGCGHSTFPLIHSLAATFLVRVPFAWYFSRPDHASLFLVGFAAPLASLFSILLCFLYYRHHISLSNLQR